VENFKQVTDFMNNNLVGESLNTVYYALQTDLPNLFEKYLTMNWNIIEMLERTLLHFEDEQMFVSGKMNILDFTEDMNIRQVKDLYSILDNEGSLFTLFNQLYDRCGTYNVRIRGEVEYRIFESFSFMSVPSPYDYFGGGFIAVLGPTNRSHDSTLGVSQGLKEETPRKLAEFYLV